MATLLHWHAPAKRSLIPPSLCHGPWSVHDLSVHPHGGVLTAKTGPSYGLDCLSDHQHGLLVLFCILSEHQKRPCLTQGLLLHSWNAATCDKHPYGRSDSQYALLERNEGLRRTLYLRLSPLRSHFRKQHLAVVAETAAAIS